MKFPWGWTVVVVLFLAFCLPDTVRMIRSRRQLAYYHKQADALIEKNRRLREQIEQLREDPLLTEKLAREELGLIREGEWVIKTR